MKNGLVDFVDYLSMLFMNDWFMNLSDNFLVNNWLLVLMDHVLMMLMDNVFVVFMNDILMMLMNLIPVRFLNYWLINVHLNSGCLGL